MRLKNGLHNLFSGCCSLITCPKMFKKNLLREEEQTLEKEVPAPTVPKLFLMVELSELFIACSPQPNKCDLIYTPVLLHHISSVNTMTITLMLEKVPHSMSIRRGLRCTCGT